MVVRVTWAYWRRMDMMVNVVEESRPVDTSSSMMIFAGPTSISPAVTRFFWPPLMPRSMGLPTGVSAQMSRPRAWMTTSAIGFPLVPEQMAVWNSSSTGSGMMPASRSRRTTSSMTFLRYPVARHRAEKSNVSRTVSSP